MTIQRHKWNDERYTMLVEYLRYAMEEVQMTSPKAAEHLDSAIRALTGDIEQMRRAPAEH